MTKIGSALALLLAAPAWADIEFHQEVDREKVGTEDTFRLTVTLGDLPEDGQLTFPSSGDFEVLSRSQSTQMSYQLGTSGAGSIKRQQHYVLVLRANHEGTITIGPSVVTAHGKTYKTESIRVEVLKGRLGPSPQAQNQRRALNPFQGFPGFPNFGDDDDGDGFPDSLTFPDSDIPRSDSDLFLRASLDKDSAYVGEQVTLSLAIYSRVDLSSVDAVTMPKLEGFWSEDIDSPTQLAPEQKVIGGVPYRAYLLRRRGLFAMKPGKLTIDAAEADITTGFLYAGHRVHRKANPLTVEVKPLPPSSPATGNVGRWRLSTEVSQTQVTLGEPMQLKVILEGRGNLKNATVPAVKAPASLKVYEPQTSDKMSITKGAIGGRRVMEYVVVPQQTGSFTLPGLNFQYFNPETEKYEESKTDAVTLSVSPAANGLSALSVPSSVPAAMEDGAKNTLVSSGLKSPRHLARFEPAAAPLWSRGFFVPVALAPAGVSLLVALGSLLGGALGKKSPASLRRKQAKAAQARLSAAHKLMRAGPATEFYAEVERALFSFIEAKLSVSVVGLTHTQLIEAMERAAVPEASRLRVVAVLERCEMGRFAPGLGDARQTALEQAQAAMEGWGA